LRECLYCVLIQQYFQLEKKENKTMANMTRWDPFNELSSLQNRINQFLGQSLPFGGTGVADQPLTFSNFVPPVDIAEDEHNITVQVEVPGINEKDLDIRLENNVLAISGERRMGDEQKRENFHRIERSYGRFVRSFALPGTIDAEHVNAQFENGLLKVTIPKRAETRPKQIKIGVGKSVPEAQRSGKEKAA
jgi:HSP20 family protein